MAWDAMVRARTGNFDVALSGFSLDDIMDARGFWKYGWWARGNRWRLNRRKTASLREIHVVRDADVAVGDLDPIEGVFFTLTGAPAP